MADRRSGQGIEPGQVGRRGQFAERLSQRLEMFAATTAVGRLGGTHQFIKACKSRFHLIAQRLPVGAVRRIQTRSKARFLGPELTPQLVQFLAPGGHLHRQCPAVRPLAITHQPVHRFDMGGQSR